MKRLIVGLLLLGAVIVMGSDRVTYLHLGTTGSVYMKGDTTSYDGTAADSSLDSFWVAFTQTGFAYADGFASLVMTIADTLTVELYAQPARATGWNYVNEYVQLSEAKLTNGATADSLVMLSGSSLNPDTYFYPVGTRASGLSGWGPCHGLKVYVRWSEDTSTKNDTSITFYAIGSE